MRVQRASTGWRDTRACSAVARPWVSTLAWACSGGLGPVLARLERFWSAWAGSGRYGLVGMGLSSQVYVGLGRLRGPGYGGPVPRAANWRGQIVTIFARLVHLHEISCRCTSRGAHTGANHPDRRARGRGEQRRRRDKTSKPPRSGRSRALGSTWAPAGEPTAPDLCGLARLFPSRTAADKDGP